MAAVKALTGGAKILPGEGRNLAGYRGDTESRPMSPRASRRHAARCPELVAELLHGALSRRPAAAMSPPPGRPGRVGLSKGYATGAGANAISTRMCFEKVIFDAA